MYYDKHLLLQLLSVLSNDDKRFAKFFPYLSKYEQKMKLGKEFSHYDNLSLKSLDTFIKYLKLTILVDDDFYEISEVLEENISSKAKVDEYFYRFKNGYCSIAVDFEAILSTLQNLALAFCKFIIDNDEKIQPDIGFINQIIKPKDCDIEEQTSYEYIESSFFKFLSSAFEQYLLHTQIAES